MAETEIAEEAAQSAEEPAQSAEEPAQSTAQYYLPELMVSSGKKYQSEKAQVTPMAITVFQGETLENRFTVDIGDVGQWAPNVTFSDVSTVPNTAGFEIRGMVSLASTLSIEPAVGIFVDGMYLGITQGALIDTFDIETMEILRGPQGTLFGRNVTGGAVVVRNRRPSGEQDLRGRTILADNNGGLWLQQNLVAETPVTDSLAAKLGIMYRDDDGYFHNLSRPGERTGGGASYLLRPQILWEPSDALDISIIGEYQEYDGDGPVFALVQDKSGNNTPVPADSDDVYHDLPGSAHYDIGSVVAEINWRIGPGKLTSISGWRQYASQTFFDADSTSTAQTTIHASLPDTSQQQFSQEIRYAMPVGERLNLTTGLYFFTQDIEFSERQQFNTSISNGNGTQDHIALAAFTHGDYALTEDLTLSMGARYTWEEKEVNMARRSTSCTSDPSQCPTDFQDKSDWGFMSGSAGLDWQATDDLLLYSSYNVSYRSGGYNLRASSGRFPGPYDEEQVDAIEIGLKADWLNGRLRTNLAGFHNTYQNLQRQILTTAAGGAGGAQISLDNAADATIVGGEFELTAFPIETLELNASIGFAEGSYDEFNGFDVDGIAGADPELAKELEFPNAKWTGYVGGRYELPWRPSIGGEFTLQASASFTDERPNVSNKLDSDGYTLVDAALVYDLPVSGMKLSLFGRNLLDTAYSSTGEIDLFFAIVENGRAPGRRLGLEFSYDF